MMILPRFVCQTAVASALCANFLWAQQTGIGQQSAPAQPGAPSAPAPPTPPLAWSASTPATMALERGSALPVAITATRPLQGVRVVYSTLQDPTSEAIIPPDSLHVGRTNACAGDAGYAPLDPKPILLCVHATTAGSYNGTVVLGALNAGEAKPFNLTVHVTSGTYRLRGAGLIALGIIVSWMVTVFLRRVSARNDALLPAAQLRGKVEELAMRIAAAQRPLGGESVVGSFNRVITDLREALSESNLTQQRYVPGVLSSAFAGSAAVGEGYPQFLQEKGTRIAVLTILIRGLEQVATIESYPIANRVGAANMIDDQAGDAAGTLEQATTAVASAIEFMKAGRVPAAAANVQLAGSGMPTTQELLMHQQFVNATTWLVWAILTLVAGYAALVLSNPGFGTPTDLVKCFLWGLGVQVAGTQLQQITPSTISSTINVSIPKP